MRGTTAQTDATLRSGVGVCLMSPKWLAGKRHSIPSVTECRSCHDSSRTEILGFSALQLSDDRDPNALHAEPLTAEMVTLRTLVDESLIRRRQAWSCMTAPPRIDAASPQTRTALGYLSTNCGSCHNRDSSIASLGLILTDSSSDNVPPALATTVGQRGTGWCPRRRSNRA